MFYIFEGWLYQYYPEALKYPEHKVFQFTWKTHLLILNNPPKAGYFLGKCGLGKAGPLKFPGNFHVGSAFFCRVFLCEELYPILASTNGLIFVGNKRTPFSNPFIDGVKHPSRKCLFRLRLFMMRFFAKALVRCAAHRHPIFSLTFLALFHENG